MSKHTHFVLTCLRGHVWDEPIPDRKLAIGEHRLCPKCGTNSWINVDAPRVTREAPKKLELSQEFVTKVTSDPTAEDVSVIGVIPRDLIPQHADPAEEHVLSEEDFLGDDVHIVGPAPTEEDLKDFVNEQSEETDTSQSES